MTWFKVDDGFHSHPKAAAASLAAIGLWSVAGSWAGDHNTDGDVPEHMIPSLSRGATELADELVACGLWRRTRTGYRFHQWSVDGDGTRRNPTRAEVEEERRKKAEAGRKGGLASGRSRKGQGAVQNAFKNRPGMLPDDDEPPRERSPTSGKARSKPQAGAKAGASRLVEPPTRPDPPPSQREGGSGGARHASRGAARAPDRDAHPPNGLGPEDPEALAREQAEIAADAEAKVRHFADLQRRTERGAAAARAAIAGARRPPPARVNGLDALREATPDVVVPLAEPKESAP